MTRSLNPIILLKTAFFKAVVRLQQYTHARWINPKDQWHEIIFFGIFLTFLMTIAFFALISFVLSLFLKMMGVPDGFANSICALLGVVSTILFAMAGLVRSHLPLYRWLDRKLCKRWGAHERHDLDDIFFVAAHDLTDVDLPERTESSRFELARDGVMATLILWSLDARVRANWEARLMRASSGAPNAVQTRPRL